MTISGLFYGFIQIPALLTVAGLILKFFVFSDMIFHERRL